MKLFHEWRDDSLKRNADQPEFLQTAQEVLESISKVLEKRRDLIEAGIIERIVKPEKIIQFRVSWGR